MPLRNRVVLFLVLCVIAGAVFFSYVRFGGRRPAQQSESVLFTTDERTLANALRRPHLVFVNTTFDEHNNVIAVAALDDLAAPRSVTTLRCERVYMTHERGLCLQADRGVLTRYYAALFDGGFRQQVRLPLQGTPSRTRLSADGRYGAFTVFVRGDSYAANSFSTRTTLVDLQGQRPVADLEQFTAMRDRAPFRSADFNYWGVTFGRDPDVFYATLATGGQLLLVRGRVSQRTVEVLHDGVECPSLSPDGARIVYKKRERANGRFSWRLHVLTLATDGDVALSEARSVDDQAEWLDNERVLYALPKENGGSDIWQTRADGTGNPQLFLEHGYSPSVVR